MTVEYNVEVEKILSREEVLLLQQDDEEKCWNIYVQLSNGKVLGCDFVISATGVVPNGGLFRDVVDVDEDGGIIVDDHLRTSDHDIFAAGDVCTAAWDHSTHWFQMRLWTQVIVKIL